MPVFPHYIADFFLKICSVLTRTVEETFLLTGMIRLGDFHFRCSVVMGADEPHSTEYGAEAPITDPQVQYRFRMATGS